MNHGILFMLRTKLKRTFLLILLLGLMACSSNLVYNNLNLIVPWYIDDFVSLNKEQMKRFKVIVDESLAWHREQELPRYQQFLTEMIVNLDSEFNQDNVDRLQSFTESSLNAVQKQLLPKLLPLFKTLDSKQQQEFWEKQDEKQKEYEEEYLGRSDSDYVNDLNERYIENSERLLGPLSDDQKLIILNGLSTMVRADAEWLESRQVWLADVKKHYEDQSGSPSEWQARVQQAWLNRDTHYTEEGQIKANARDNQAKQIMLSLINSRTDKQTLHAKEYLQGWQETLSTWRQN